MISKDSYSLKVAAPLTEPLDLLLVDDEPDFLEPACRFFLRQGYRVVAAASAEQALAVQAKQHFQVAVLDQNMPGMNGLELGRRLVAADPEIRIVMLTGNGSITSAVEAMKFGAVDYLTKPFGLSDLDACVRRVALTGRLERENRHLRRQLAIDNPGKNDLVGQSSVIHEVKRLIERIAASDKPALIQGESGTGKELVARAIHAKSPLADRPLVVINCAALPESLLESELFGYEKGAFTGANEAKPGLFEIADGGSLFIDEFGELAGGLQAKLLRVLEDGSMRRVGAVRERKVKVRLIAATNRDLLTEVAAGRFREDLYYRVNVLSIQLPSLRDRTEDIPMLVDHFLKKPWKLDSGVMELFMSAPWPGNVRQLLNALERGKILSDDGIIHLENLPAELRKLSPIAGGPTLTSPTLTSPTLTSPTLTSPTLTSPTLTSPTLTSPTLTSPTQPSQTPIELIGSSIGLNRLSQMHIQEVMKRNNGNKAKSARELGVARRSLYRLLERFNVQ